MHLSLEFTILEMSTNESKSLSYEPLEGMWLQQAFAAHAADSRRRELNVAPLQLHAGPLPRWP